jgi:branched-subunit amino acid ABC-type transport system permease component
MSVHFLGGDSVEMTIWGLLLLVIIVSPRGLFGQAATGKGKL